MWSRGVEQWVTENQQTYDPPPKKTQTQRNNIRYFFLRRVDFLKIWKAQRIDVYRAIIQQSDKHVV